MPSNDFKMPDRSLKAVDQLIKKNVAHRQQLKKKWDRRCKYDTLPMNLSDALEFNGQTVECDFKADGANENWVRLLDEGVVVDGVDDIFAVIKKGVLKKAFNAIPEDFVGNIDKDHNRSIELGTFTKNELRLVKLENDRYGIDVNVKLDDELYAVRDLKRIGRKCAISSEFFSIENEFVKKSTITGKKEEFDYLVPLIEEVQITGYAVCDAPKNANSYDEGLLNKASTEEGLEMDPEELKKQQEAALAEAEAEAKEVADEGEAEATDQDFDSAEVTTEGEEANPSEGTDQIDASAEDIADEGEAEAEETADEGEATDASAEEADEEVIAKFEARLNELQKEIEAKDAKINELESKLAAKTESKNAFRAKLEKMLDFTTAVDQEPAAGEGEKDNNTEAGDEIVNEYKSAFAELNKEQ